MYTTKKLGTEIENKEKRMNADFHQDFSAIRRYIMTDFSLSHHQSLELLNDLSDHILESQYNGTPAEKFFGDNLELFANDLVSELPKEKTTFKASVIGYAVFNMVALLLLIMMSIELFLNIIENTHLNFYPIGLVVAFSTFLFGLLGGLFLLLNIAHLDEFNKKNNTFLKELPIYILGGLAVFGSYMIFKNMDAGPKIHLEWYGYLILAIIAATLGHLCSKKVD
ncbi:DUF1129 family protein [Macrococcoides canis]|uniref:DUF1129 family protein n=1 Tax=Macrococcoides canis TaxID=1855823 RepID=UPI001B8C8D9D|nr:DUF1129 family protein [Macrococcus canis]QUR94590.1 DUF1129 family protein [Macrococcus canis]UTH06896.1 DUF1129 family protein [Macrococcus canis]